MRKDGFILAKLKIDFLTQEMKDRQGEREKREEGGVSEGERRRRHTFSIMHAVKVS